MRKLSLPAIVIFLLFVFGAIFLKDQFLNFEGPLEYGASAGAGAIGGLIGAMIGMSLFPKKGDKND